MLYKADESRAASRIIDGEAVLIDLKTSHYYSLNESGTMIWNLLQNQGGELSSITAEVAEKYKLDAATVKSEVEQFLSELVAEGLLTMQECENAPSVPRSEQTPGEYFPPRLMKFDQLEQLILSAE